MKHWHKRGTVVAASEVPTSLILDDEEDGMHFLSDCKTCATPISGFVRVSDSRYHAVESISNLGSLGLVMSRDNEAALLQCFS